MKACAMGVGASRAGAMTTCSRKGCAAPVRPTKARAVPGYSVSAAQQGFTLLEVLIALALTALLMSMLTAGVYGVMRDWDDNAEALEHSLDQAVIVLQIERALQGAFPHSYQHPDTMGRHVYFEGERDALSWISTVSPQRTPGMMAWQISNGTEGVYLRLAPAMADHPGGRLMEAEPRLLLPDYRASFRYLFEDAELQRRWRDDWPGADANVLPLAVHVVLTATVGATPPLEIVAPIATHRHRYLSPNEGVIQ